MEQQTGNKYYLNCWKSNNARLYNVSWEIIYLGFDHVLWLYAQRKKMIMVASVWNLNWFFDSCTQGLKTCL